VLYQCRLPPRTTRTDRWQLYERLECQHLIRVRFDHLGQLTTAVRRRCDKCAKGLAVDPISESEIETRILLPTEESTDERQSGKFVLGKMVTELLDINLDGLLETPAALYAALETQGCRWSGTLWFVLQGCRYELLMLEKKGYYGVVYDPNDVQIGTTDPCGDDRGMAEKNGRELVEQSERLNFQEKVKNV